MTTDFSTGDLAGVVKEVLKSFREIYIVIDAIDECEQSDDVLRWIQELVKTKDGRLHMLFSSRQDYQLQRALVTSTTSILALDEYSFEKDIQLYIQEQLNTDPRLMKWPPDVQNEIGKSLVANAGGL